MVKPQVNLVYRVVKRSADVLIAALALLLLWPLLLVLTLLVRRDGGPAIFRQQRMGRGGRPFTLYKFRSMRLHAERLEDCLTPEELAEYKKECKLIGDPRITPIGHFLRKSSLDELPQLINILKGDMSLVGPRPLLDWELEQHYTPEERERLTSVRPGLTGYWQAVSRNQSTYQTGERQRQELYYIGRVNPAMDIKILVKTVGRVFSGEGAV